MEIKRISSMSVSERRELISRFNQEHYVIVTLKGKNICPKTELAALKRIFGDAAPHDRADSNGIVPISICDSEKIYLSASSAAHMLHTDGTFMKQPPMVNALFCVHPSECGGGRNILVQAQEVYHSMQRRFGEDLAPLYDLRALTVSRQGSTAQHPIFKEIDGRIQMLYRNDQSASITIHPRAKDIFDRLVDVIRAAPRKEFSLARNQLIIMDNTAVLHGRTAFERDSQRLLYRMDMNGISPYRHQLLFGFLDVLREQENKRHAVADDTSLYSSKIRF